MCHDLLDEHVPVILQGTGILTPLEAKLATSANAEPMFAYGDDLGLDVGKRLQVFQELADGVICPPLATASDECNNLLQAIHRSLFSGLVIP